MENLLFESKGITKKHKLIIIICSIILIACGILVLFIRNMKSNTINVSMYGLIGTGHLGGRYILTDDARNAFMIFGIIIILLGVLCFYIMNNLNKSYVKIYEDRIVGIIYAGMIFFTYIKNYEIAYAQIEDVQMIRNSLYSFIFIKAYGKRYGILVKENAEEALQIIRKRVNEVQHQNI